MFALLLFCIAVGLGVMLLFTDEGRGCLATVFAVIIGIIVAFIIGAAVLAGLGIVIALFIGG